MGVVMVKSDARAREKPCLRCGLSLRGRMDITHCPRCGLSVWLSLNNNDALDWSSPVWLAKLSAAAWIMAAAQTFGLASFLLSLVADETGRWMIPLLSIPYLLAYHSGLLLLATHERRYPDRLAGHRIALMVFAGLGLAAGVAVGAMLFAPPERLWILWLPVKLVVVAASLTTWLYLGKLARRVPSTALARICNWLALAPAASLLLAFPLLFLLFASWIIAAIALAAMILPVVYLPFSAGLLVVFARAFTRAGISARKSWAAETRPPGVAGT